MATKKPSTKSGSKPKPKPKAGKKAAKKAGKKASKKTAKKAGKKLSKKAAAEARKKAKALAERIAKAYAKRQEEKALRLAGGEKIIPALYKKKGKKACSRTRSGKCRTKGEVRLLATALKLDACKPGTLPTKFGRRAGEYVELMKYQTAPRQWMPAAYLGTITPLKREVLEVKLNAQGLPVRDKKTGAMIPKKWVSRPAYGKLVQLAKRLPPGGVRAKILGGK